MKVSTITGCIPGGPGGPAGPGGPGCPGCPGCPAGFMLPIKLPLLSRIQVLKRTVGGYSLKRILGPRYSSRERNFNAIYQQRNSKFKI